MSGFDLKRIVPFVIIALTVIFGIVVLFLMPTVGLSVLGLEPGRFPIPVLVATGVMVLSPGIYAVLRKKF